MHQFEKLRALPVQFTQNPEGVILKRGCTELRISGEGAAAVIAHILTLTMDGGATGEEICERFALPQREAVRKLIDQLMTKRILVSSDQIRTDEKGPESSLEIFYWHFGASAHKVVERLNERQIAILGVNHISRQLAGALMASGVEKVQVIDFPLLRSLRLFDAKGQLNTTQWSGGLPVSYKGWMEETAPKDLGCLVATSDYGCHEVLTQWNSFCLEHKIHFLPVTLQNLVGCVGPLVVPGETACYECLRARQNSHLENPSLERATEATSFQSQPFIGFHPSMASILGDIAAFELTKFYSGVIPQWNVGTMIEVNLLATHLTTRKVLKVPRCRACSPVNSKAVVELVKPVIRTPDQVGT